MADIVFSPVHYSAALKATEPKGEDAPETSDRRNHAKYAALKIETDNLQADESNGERTSKLPRKLNHGKDLADPYIDVGKTDESEGEKSPNSTSSKRAQKKNPAALNVGLSNLAHAVGDIIFSRKDSPTTETTPIDVNGLTGSDRMWSQGSPLYESPTNMSVIERLRFGPRAKAALRPLRRFWGDSVLSAPITSYVVPPNTPMTATPGSHKYSDRGNQPQRGNVDGEAGGGCKTFDQSIV
ncbi:hypothetical protein HGRIS_001747 [Hohenbuehelia grisea]|uniref:Uncharacterized protein n=1 Tax=Hohenbuehelia grisea TaxID=104357 RepID=A0ABR3JJM2_9AGAR